MDSLVTILLPCYNARATIDTALNSLVQQSYRDLEILVIDDGSDDGTSDAIRRHAARDRRIRAERSDTNNGLIVTLNHGLQLARGAFIARIDADDIAARDRISTQVAFLMAHPDIAVLGSGEYRIDANTGRPLKSNPVRCFWPVGTRFMSLFANPVSHPTIMARAPILRSYRYGGTHHASHTEDYELFARMLADGHQFANLPQRLVTRLIGPHGVSARNEAQQINNFVECARRHLARETGITATPGCHRVFVNRLDSTSSACELRAGISLLNTLEQKALRDHPDDVTDIRRVADMQYLDIVLQALRRGNVSVKAAALSSTIRNPSDSLSADARFYLGTKLRRLPTRG